MCTFLHFNVWLLVEALIYLQVISGDCQLVSEPPRLENILPLTGVVGSPTATACGDGWQHLCAFGGAVWRQAEGTLNFTVMAGVLAGVDYEFALILVNGAEAQSAANLSVSVVGSIASPGTPVTSAGADAAPGYAYCSI